MTRPLIGITAAHVQTEKRLPAVRILQAYVTAIVEAGGAPLLIPPDLPEDGWRLLLDRLDGFLFSGGADITPGLFDGEPHPTVTPEPVRDAIEIPLLRAAVEADKPVLGICRGFQVMNVALGGTLYTHILDQHPNALQHNTPDELPRTHLAHPVTVTAGTRLAGILGLLQTQVNSLHHQGIRDLAPGLVPSAFAPDGLIEGIELPQKTFVLGVQWHPEWLTSHSEMRNLFYALVDAAGG